MSGSVNAMWMLAVLTIYFDGFIHTSLRLAPVSASAIRHGRWSHPSNYGHLRSDTRTVLLLTCMSRAVSGFCLREKWECRAAGK